MSKTEALLVYLLFSMRYSSFKINPNLIPVIVPVGPARDHRIIAAEPHGLTMQCFVLSLPPFVESFHCETTGNSH